MAELLSDEDLRKMTDLLSSAATPVGPHGGLPDAVLVDVAGLIGCDFACFTDTDPACETSYLDQTFDGWVVETEGLIRDTDEPFWRHYWASDACSYPTRTGDARSVTLLSDFYSQHEWHATPMYTEVLGSDGVEHEMMSCLTIRGTRSGRVILIRGHGSDFDERDRMVLALLRPHLAEIHARQRSAVSTADSTTPILTPRQTELLRLVAAGRSTAQIAAALYLSPNTVRKHFENIFNRLDVTSRTAAVMRVFADEVPLELAGHIGE
jgi:DNA-binding CsgD family transcriptional regulator